MEDSDNSTAVSSLLFRQSEPSLGGGRDNEEDEVYMDYNCYPTSPPEEGYIQNLILEESCLGSDAVCSETIPTWINSARNDAIDWIMNVRTFQGFHHRTAYLSIDYFDRFLSKQPIGEGKYWAIRLLSIACLSIAAKLVEERAPALSGFLLEGRSFKGLEIRRMELLVLNTLAWRMRPITPFDYLHFFVNRLWSECKSKPRIRRAVGFIFAVTREINLMNYSPSIIAPAAILAAMDCKLTRDMVELKLGSVPSLMLPRHEDVHFFYNLMQEIDKNTPRSAIISQETSSLRQSMSVGFVEHSSTKRKLPFDKPDTNNPLKKANLL